MQNKLGDRFRKEILLLFRNINKVIQIDRKIINIEMESIINREEK